MGKNIVAYKWEQDMDLRADSNADLEKLWQRKKGVLQDKVDLLKKRL